MTTNAPEEMLSDLERRSLPRRHGALGAVRASMSTWERLRAQEDLRRAREGHLTSHPAFEALMTLNNQDESWVCWLLREDSAGLNPLMKAAMGACAKTAELLLAHHSPDARDARGLTALMIAAERGNAEVCALLVPLSPLKARSLEGLDALGMARNEACRSVILSHMARAERALIDPCAVLGHSDQSNGQRGRL
jgi:hypothetical protein